MKRRIMFTVRVKNHPAFVEMPFSRGVKTLPRVSLKNMDTITKPMINAADVKKTTG